MTMNNTNMNTLVVAVEAQAKATDTLSNKGMAYFSSVEEAESYLGATSKEMLEFMLEELYVASIA